MKKPNKTFLPFKRYNLIFKAFISFIFIILTFSICNSAQVNDAINSHQIKKIISEDNRSIDVESGFLSVPENHRNRDSKKISIAFQRLKTKSKQPSTAIFLLAGGPGGSWINTLHLKERFSEVLFYHQFSDVILFDQRGAGRSVPLLNCTGIKQIPLNKTLTNENRKIAIREAAKECQEFWGNQGVNLASYNTDESAQDMNDLRIALGYDKITLIGGSYGSHLGLHYMRKYPDNVDRAIFYGLEGPDHTWDVPSEVMNTLKRIASIAEKSNYYQNQIPKQGLLWALEQVIERVIEDNPKVKLEIDGHQTEVIINKFVIQALASYKAGKRKDFLSWPDLILDMYNGDFTFPAKVSMAMHDIKIPSAMSKAMDFASGISKQRYQQIKNDPAHQLLGDINSTYTTQNGIWPDNDLGDDYRKNMELDHPILLIHGTWDTSTPIENAIELNSVLKNSHLIKIKQGGHNALYDLFEFWPPVLSQLERFLLGNKTNLPNTITLPNIIFPGVVTKEQIDLWNASKSGNIEAAIIALNSGADVNALDTRKSKSGRRPLNYASWSGNVNFIDWLLTNNADINAQNKTGYTALHHAVENCQIKSYKTLIRHNANIEITNFNKTTLIETATSNNCQKILLLLNQRKILKSEEI